LKSSYQKFARDTLVIGVANVLLALSRFILLPLLTKTLGAHDYGIWAQAQVTIGLVLGVVGLGLPYALTRFLPAKTQKEEIREEFWSVFSLVSLTTFIVSLVLIAAASPTFFRAFRQMKRYALFVVGDAYIELAVIAFLVLKGYGLLNALLAVLAVRSMIFIPLLFLINSQVRIKRPHFSKIKEYLSFGLPTVPGNLASWVVASSDRYVIGYYLGATSVGIYSAAYGLGSLMIMLVGVLGFVLPPTLSKLYDEGKIDEIKTYLSYSLRYSLAVGIPFVFGVAILARPILRLFSTAEIAREGYFVVSLTALSTLLFTIGASFRLILVLVKKTHILALIWISSAILNLILNIWIVPYAGILGAAITTLATYLLSMCISIRYARRELKFNIQWRFILKSLGASAIMSVVMWLIHPQNNSVTMITTLIGVIVYGIALVLLRAFKREEITFLRDLVRSFLRFRA